MSRIKKFTHSLVSGYALLGTNAIYTLVSVPLALHYLSRPEFGLWALVAQIAGYVALIDFGMSGSVARILIDHKDDRRGAYGGMLQTGALVGLTQGALIFLAGTVLAFFIGPLLKVPADLARTFVWLMIGQCAVTAFMFATRIFSHALVAHQRFDVNNYAGIVNLTVSLAIMWFGFTRGWGIFSFLWGQCAGTILTAIVNAIACSRLELFPRRGEWSRPTWKNFHELFAFGRDIFLYSLGTQFALASQAILLTRLVGLDAAAVWSVGVRAFLLLTSFIYRIFDFSSSALAEMMVRHEKELLRHRFQQIVELSANLSVAAGTMFAVCNGTFIRVWSSHKIEWPPVNDLLLAIWLVICVAIRFHSGLAGQTKKLRALRYIYFIEGISFVGLNLMLHRFASISLMLSLSIFCSLCFSFPYCLRRTREFFDLKWTDFLRWHRDTLTMLLWLAPSGFLIWWLARTLPDVARLAVEAVTLGIWTTWIFLRYGLGTELHAELYQRAPNWAKSILRRTILDSAVKI